MSQFDDELRELTLDAMRTLQEVALPEDILHLYVSRFSNFDPEMDLRNYTAMWLEVLRDADDEMSANFDDILQAITIAPANGNINFDVDSDCDYLEFLAGIMYADNENAYDGDEDSESDSDSDDSDNEEDDNGNNDDGNDGNDDDEVDDDEDEDGDDDDGDENNNYELDFEHEGGGAYIVDEEDLEFCFQILNTLAQQFKDAGY